MRKLEKQLLVMNDDWQVSDVGDGNLLVESRDGKWTLGPMPGEKIRTLIAIVEHVDQRIKNSKQEV